MEPRLPANWPARRDSKKDLDIVMLQECPGPKWAEDEMLRGRGFVSVGSPKASHAGYVVLLLKREFFNGERVYPPRQRTSLPRGLPVVAAEVTMPLLRGNGSSASAPSSARCSLVLASCHLEPFEQGSLRRQQQVDGLLGAVANDFRGVPMNVAGDTNMRHTNIGT